eukprot:scaffold85453_cov54-Phaeocystis_antarctica.AAC.6
MRVTRTPVGWVARLRWAPCLASPPRKLPSPPTQRKLSLDRQQALADTPIRYAWAADQLCYHWPADQLRLAGALDWTQGGRRGPNRPSLDGVLRHHRTSSVGGGALRNWTRPRSGSCRPSCAVGPRVGPWTWPWARLLSPDAGRFSAAPGLPRQPRSRRASSAAGRGIIYYPVRWVLDAALRHSNSEPTFIARWPLRGLSPMKMRPSSPPGKRGRTRTTERKGPEFTPVESTAGSGDRASSGQTLHWRSASAWDAVVTEHDLCA